MKTFFTGVASWLLHLGAAIVIVIAFWPMARWYFEAKPLWGVDFYYTATLVKMMQANLVLPPLSWNYAWFAGWPIFSYQPMLQYLLIVPFTLFFDLLAAVKIWMLISLGLYILGCYAVSFTLSRNRGLAIILAICAIYSVGVYGTLMWGGSLPNHATQAFLPWTLLLIILYLKNKNIRYLFGAGLLSGLALLGHPQIVIAYIFPSSAILFIFSAGQLKLLDRLKSGALFVLLSFVVGLPLIYTSAGSLQTLIVTNSFNSASSTARVDSQVAQDIKAFNLAQPTRMYTDTNQTIFFLLASAIGFYLFLFIFKHGKAQFFPVVPYFILAVYYIFYTVIYAYGISMYHGGWYRLFWATPLWLGLAISAFWGVAETSLRELLGRLKIVIIPLMTITILIVGAVMLIFYSRDVKERIVLRSNPSSAFPDVLNLRIDSAGFERLRGEMVPGWLPADSTDYRLYDGDQTVNIWWNALYKMPLARGYLDPPIRPALGYRFWVDAALSIDSSTSTDQLVGSFKYPEDIAYNNTLFLIDWYAIKYFEAGHASPTAYAPLPLSLTGAENIVHTTELEFNQERYNLGNQSLKYYEVKNELVSPIITGVDSPTLGIVATDKGYETVIRAIADTGLGVRHLIPLKLGSSLDQLKAADLSGVDALVIYDYRYQNKQSAFRFVSDFVRQGRPVFIDTGTEIPESDATELPEIFPVTQTTRKPLGRDWQLEILDDALAKGVDITQFAPPIFDDSPWNFSYPRQPDNLRSGVAVWVKNHNVAIMAMQKIGGGEVIWSGMNLPYHVTRWHMGVEVQFWKNLILRLLPQAEVEQKLAGKAEFVTPEKRRLTVQGIRGAIFKEQAYEGWMAFAGGNQLQIYKAGPAYPGFMYVAIPAQLRESTTTLTWVYRGAVNTWIFTAFSAVTGLLLAEESLLGGIFFGRIIRKTAALIKSRIKKWWAREDEE